MYTSATGSNWDDDDEDFNLEVYNAAATAFPTPAPTTNDINPLQRLPAIEEEEDEGEVEQLSSPVVSNANTAYDCDPDFWPLYARKGTKLWDCTPSRPAYSELSHDGFYCYPDQRVEYHANWVATKLRMGANMRSPMMMKPSPLKLSRTWVQGSTGVFCREAGCLFSPAPSLREDGSSDEERDEAKTPPGSPPTVLHKDGVEEVSSPIQAYAYDTDQNQEDPTTGAIDLTAHNIDVGRINLVCKTDDVNSIAENIDAGGILRIPESNKALVEHSPQVPNTASTSPDLKYIHNHTNTSLVWIAVATGWFALSALPWSRIAIASAGTLFDIVASIARR